MRLITWEMALGQLKVSIPEASPLMAPFEADIRHKIEIAEEMVIEHVDQRLGPTSQEWSATVALWNVEGGSPSERVPALVQGAVLRVLKELDRFRGDDIDSDTPQRPYGTLSPMVVSMLHRLRDPAIA